MADHFISNKNFYEFVRKLLESSAVVAPVRYKNVPHLQIIDQTKIASIDLSGWHAIETFKPYIFSVIEKVSDYFGPEAEKKARQVTLLGVRGCDLEGINVEDRVFLEGDFKDSFYENNRKNLLVIAADCTECGKTCFCTTVGGKPWPVSGYDLNLSPVREGFVVSAGSEKGSNIIRDNPKLFIEAFTYHMDGREKNRKKVLGLLREANRDFPLRSELSAIHKANLSNKVWRTLTKDCVECSACNLICPSCTCFLLVDQKSGRVNQRYKEWDACLKAGYARVAGGANSRGRLYERLQNRYHCKFDYSYDRLGRYTCVGCGRCIDACAGNIDMRKIFVELEKQAPLTAKLEE